MADGSVAWNRKISRQNQPHTMHRQPPQTQIVMEACSTSHFWGRTLISMDYDVKLIPTQHVKAFARHQKNDANDALATCETACRPRIRCVLVKTTEQKISRRYVYRLNPMGLYIMLTTAQIELVQKAWGRVSASNKSYVKDVYDELLGNSPELACIFPNHPALPIDKLTDTLNTLVTSLEQLDALAFIIKDLGRRHLRFNVKPEHFTLLEKAMTSVLARRLGSQFTPELGKVRTSP